MYTSELFFLILGEINVMFALLDSQGFVTVWDTRYTQQPLHHVNIEMLNTRGDTIQIQVKIGPWDLSS